jgi:hypothetical protein
MPRVVHDVERLHLQRGMPRRTAPLQFDNGEPVGGHSRRLSDGTVVLHEYTERCLLLHEPVPKLMSLRRSTGVLRAFRRRIRPLILGLLRAMPSPEKCGCASRKEWMIKQIEAI